MSLLDLENRKEATIIFLGDSLFEYCNFSSLFNRSIINMGIAGDTTEDILFRAKNLKADKIFLLVGINDLYIGSNLDEIIKNYKKIISILDAKEIYSLSLLPTRDVHMVNRIKELNVNISKLDSKFIDIYDHFIDENSLLKLDYSFDGIHLTDRAYFKMVELLAEYLDF